MATFVAKFSNLQSRVSGIAASSGVTIATSHRFFVLAVCWPVAKQKEKGSYANPFTFYAGFVRTHATSRHPYAQWRAHVAGGKY
jgi:hypothetical protein